LRKVNNWSAHERTENTSVGDGKGSTSHILNGELVVTSLLIESAEEQWQNPGTIPSCLSLQ
jgi:hypothetical protein